MIANSGCCNTVRQRANVDGKDSWVSLTIQHIAPIMKTSYTK